MYSALVVTARIEEIGVEKCREVVEFVDENPLPCPTARVWVKGGEGVKIIIRGNRNNICKNVNNYNKIHSSKNP